MKKIGLIINPIAGLGGTVGLKGTDNIYEEAIALGAKPKAIDKTMKVLKKIDINKIDVFYTASGEMGEELLKKINVNYECTYQYKNKSSRYDTTECAKSFLEKDIDLLIFVGGDGTARDIYNAVGEDIAVIGIPAGVKMQSSVFAKNVLKASNLINEFLNNKIYLRKREVIDLDEEMYRKGEIQSKLYGYLSVPYNKQLLQNKKSRTLANEVNNQIQIAHDVCDNMDEKVLYIIGPGSTTKAIMDVLNLKNTLIGVDLISNKRIVKNDVTKNEIINTISNYNKVIIIITPIGGQGYIFGRGNQQISSTIIMKVGKENIFIVATKSKIAGLENQMLLIDTGCEKTDKYIKGYYKVITGYNEKSIIKVSE